VWIENLRYTYPDGTEALRGVSLCVPEGARLGVVGPNGCGKSTLLLHLNGLLRGRGRLEVLGMPVEPPHLAQIRRAVGLVFQNPDDQLFMPTVFDEVAYAAVNAGLPADEVRRRVTSALSAVGLDGIEHKHPANLSLGQKKRVCIASVLVTDTRLLVLDEPSAGLDPAGGRALVALLSDLPQTMVIASHDLHLVGETCGRVALMAGGVITHVGDTAEVLADAALLAASGL
jgi:cobalt/nickel transport system ATP-binding protein